MDDRVLLNDLVCPCWGRRSHFLCNSLPSTRISLPPLHSCSLLWGHLATHQKGEKQRNKGNKTQFEASWLHRAVRSQSVLLGLLWSCLGTYEVLQPRGLFQTWFPLGMTHYSRFQRSNCNSCLGSSNCFELHTIWINLYEINKGWLFCNLLLKLAGVISGDITFPSLAFDYSTNTSPLFNWSFLVECNRNLF